MFWSLGVCDTPHVTCTLHDDDCSGWCVKEAKALHLYCFRVCGERKPLLPVHKHPYGICVEEEPG